MQRSLTYVQPYLEADSCRCNHVVMEGNAKDAKRISRLNELYYPEAASL